MTSGSETLPDASSSPVSASGAAPAKKDVAPGPAAGDRYTALDGLRGIAALVVVFHHSLLTASLLARPYREHALELDGIFRVLTYTPLHLPWAGTEAVMVFFVLSGFVLVLPFDRPGPKRLARYYSQRLTRLYLPIWASVTFAVMLATIFPLAATHTSWWVNAHAGTVTSDSVLHQMTVVRGVTFLDSPLWSMRWEVIFSLLLPLFLIGALWWRKAALLKIALLAAVLLYAWSTGRHASMLYLPVFGIGCCLAAIRTQISAFMIRIGRPGFWVLLLVSLGLLSVTWISPSINSDLHLHARAMVLMILGGALLVALFVGSPTAAVIGNSAVCRWLGTISFSLYLTHEPIVIAVANLWPSMNAGVVLIVVTAVSLPVAVVFQRIIERPAHLFSRRVGAAVGSVEDRLFSGSGKHR